jgi:hypothetical protein
MPPKPVVPQTFKTPDGKVFNTRAEWRDYMMLTFYSFKNINNAAEPQVKLPDSIQGQTFEIGDCENSILVVMDHTEQIQVDQLKGCRVFLGAVASSLFIRNCENCTFVTACQQLRLREVVNCNFYILSIGEVHIEYSNNVRFAPFNGGYPEQAAHLAAAKLNPHHNLWYDIYDHNDPNKTREHWSLIPESEYEAPWFPAGSPCEVAIPRTRAGSVVRADANDNMQSFSMDQMRMDASKATGGPAATAAAVPPAPVVAATAAPPVPHVEITEADIIAALAATSAVRVTSAETTKTKEAAVANESGKADQAALRSLIESFATLKAGDNTSVDDGLLVFIFVHLLCYNDCVFFFFFFLIEFICSYCKCCFAYQ